MQGIVRGRILMLIAVAALAGCSGQSSPVAGGGTDTPVDTGPAPVVTTYDLASRCFVARNGASYIVRSGSGFAATGKDASAAEHFYMKATGLVKSNTGEITGDRYLFYTADGKIMTGSGSSVSATDSPDDGSDWSFAGANPAYTATALGLPLSLDGAGALVLGGTAAPLAFEEATGCVEYPEMPIDIGPTFKSNPVGSRVIGIAEVHSHMGMGSEMSDGSGHVGPSSGGVFYGQAMNRFGAPEALKNCIVMHGPDGILSAENIILDQNPTETHDTVGWPTFVGWPKYDSFLHQQMYWRWIERAYRAGLRVMVIHGTTIEALCNIAKLTFGDKTAECVDQEVGTLQVKYLYDIQDYIDAQYGGPGKGWYRIVKSPAEARQVIADGKLAVVPGLEFSNLFHCRVTFLPTGGEVDGCTKEQIDTEIDESWNNGVRQIFPFHDVDSALGGTGIFSSILNEVGFTNTLGFWKTYPCDNGGEGDTYFYPAGAVMETAAVTQYAGSISELIASLVAGKLPIYPAGRQCNARTVTDLGKYAIDKIMKKGFVFDIDHAEIKSKQYMLDQGARFTPNYPMISGHGGQGGISNDQAVQIIRQGGIIYPALPNGKGFADFVQQMKPIWAASGTTRPLSIGYGADSNGLRTLPNSRGAGSQPIVYPFKLFQGAGWGPQYAAAGIKPITVDQLSIPGGKTWNMDEEGMSHYGLVADIIDEVAIEGGEEATTALYNSAETYLELWEQTVKASENARTVPVP